MSRTNSIHSCDICRSTLPQSHLEIALCPNESCASLFHLTCLASRFDDTNFILPVKGMCPSCQREISWGDVIRGVFGRSGQMESNNLEDDDVDDTDEDDDEDDEDVPTAPRKKRVSGLVRLTGKPKTPQKSAPKKSRTTRGKTTKADVAEILASDDNATPKPVTKRKPRGRPKSIKTKDVEMQGRRTKETESTTMVPDSAGEAKDVCIISSDDD